MNRKEAMFNAYFHLREAAEHAMRCDQCISLGFPGNIYEECLREEFAKAAKALGYDLVKREEKKEAA